MKEFIDWLNSHKTKLTGAILVTLSYIQTNPALKDLMSAKAYAWTIFFVGMFVIFLGFLNGSQANVVGGSGKQDGFARISFLAILALAAFAFFGCAQNPLVQAQTLPQKAWALYGEYTIFQGKAAELVVDSATPYEVRQALSKADAVAYPLAEELANDAAVVEDLQGLLNACQAGPEPCKPDDRQRLENAVANLSAIYFRAQPVLLQLVAVVKGAKK